jgi:hypothetical protein
MYVLSRRRSRRLGRTDKLSWAREPPLTPNVFILFILCVREVEHVQDIRFDKTLKLGTGLEPARAV